MWQSVFHPGRLEPQTAHPIPHGEAAVVRSFEGHSFRAQWADERVGHAAFQMGAREAIVTVLPSGASGLRVVYRDAGSLEHQVNATVEDCVSSLTLTSPPEELTTCLVTSLSPSLSRLRERGESSTRFHHKLAHRVRNYTCGDPSLHSTPAASTFTWSGHGAEGVEMGRLLDTSHAKIMSLSGFVTEEECAALRAHGEPHLRQATVAGEDGGSVVVDARRAKQASYSVRREDDPLMPLRRRVFAFTNNQTGYGLDMAGQEGFTFISYDAGDAYYSHCDGSCDNSPHAPGGRVATMVLYCEVADVGGGTSFPRADIYLRPKRGDAAFFSYLGPDGKMDEGLTEYSGCDVVEGRKIVVTQWMRLGVDSTYTWEAFDPHGVPNSLFEHIRRREEKSGVDR